MPKALPHAEIALELQPAKGDFRAQWASILFKAGWYADEVGSYNTAEKMIRAVIADQALELDYPMILASKNNLAEIYRKQGRWKEAEELEIEVLETSKRVLGHEHPSTIVSMANLASAFWNQGRWKEAERLETQVLEISKRVLGTDHPATLTSMANLASTIWNQGQWREAEELEVQVLETSKRVLGAEHPDTLISMANLASTFYSQNRLTEAEELGVQVLEMGKRVLGAEHPDTLISMANLASTVWNQNRFKEAEELEIQVLGTSKRVLGAEHPDTLTSMANLAFTWKGQNRDKEALELMERCALLQARILGVDHPYTSLSSTALVSWHAERVEVGAAAAEIWIDQSLTVDSNTSELQNVERHVFIDSVNPADIKAILKNILGTEKSDLCTATISVFWELQDCVQDELHGNADLGPYLTLSGKPDRACAMPCLEYVESSWGDSGRAVLQCLQNALKKCIEEGKAVEEGKFPS
jgi:tetratricopeptide (TPR) repeat protein